MYIHTICTYLHTCTEYMCAHTYSYTHVCIHIYIHMGVGGSNGMFH